MLGPKNLLRVIKSVDIIRDPDSGIINCHVELPGVKSEEIRLTVRDGRLVIDGTRHLPIRDNARKSRSRFLLHEVKYGRIHRKIALPPDTQVSLFSRLGGGSSLLLFQAHEISAILMDGMLEMTWPSVSAHTKPPRRIEITDAEQ